MVNVSIFLPKKVSLNVVLGDEVVCGQVLANEPEEHVVYDLVKLLSVPLKDLKNVVKKQEGETVKRGEILAAKSSWLPFSGKSVRAAFDGKIISIDWEKGTIELLAHVLEGVSVVSPANGKVAKIDKEAIVIDFKGSIVFAKQGTGNMKKGQLTVVGKADSEVLLTDIKAEQKGCVLLGGYFPRVVLQKAYGLGVGSVLATTLDEGDFLYDASVLLLAKTDYNILKAYEGKDVVVEGMHKRVILGI